MCQTRLAAKSPIPCHYFSTELVSSGSARRIHLRQGHFYVAIDTVMTVFVYHVILDNTTAKMILGRLWYYNVATPIK